MFFYTYVLLSKLDNKFYIGYTPNDVFYRFSKHTDGLVESTKHRRPLELIYYEAFLNELDAIRREKYFKTSKGRTTLKYMIRNYLETKN